MIHSVAPDGEPPFRRLAKQGELPGVWREPCYRMHLVPLRSVAMPCEAYNRHLALILVSMARAVENRRVDD